jgi:predicted nuclease of restriction endonuclease-like (RecB) superfamily
LCAGGRGACPSESSILKHIFCANRQLIDLYWSIGQSIVEKQEAFGWGKSVVEKLSGELQAEFGGIQGFSARNLWNMRDFYRNYVGHKILQPMVAEISWAKNLVIMSKCKDNLQREFYIRMTKKYGWTKAVLVHQIEGRKSKNRTVVEYALKTAAHPMGIATYTITNQLPEAFARFLPSEAEIVERLRVLEERV